MTSVNWNISMVRYITTPSRVYGRLFTWTRMVDFNAKDFYRQSIKVFHTMSALKSRYLFFDKVKSLGIDSFGHWALRYSEEWFGRWYEAVVTGHVPRCYLIETPGDLTWKKLKAYNFVISERVKPLQVLKRNSGYDSHDATSSSSSFPILPPTSALPLFNEGLGISPW